MKGVSYLKDQEGNKTHLVLDLSVKHQEAVVLLLEELEDIASVQNANPNDVISLKEVREHIIKKGVPEETLSAISNDV